MGGLKLGAEAQAKFDEAKRNPDYQGLLDKKGAKRKNWNQRWFVLKDNYLFYCKNQKSNPQGIINLHGCTVSRIEGPTARPNSFSVLAPKSVSIDAKWTNRTYFFAAKDAKEMEKWMEIVDKMGKQSVDKAAAAKKKKEVDSGEKKSSDDKKDDTKKDEPKKDEPKKDDAKPKDKDSDDDSGDDAKKDTKKLPDSDSESDSGKEASKSKKKKDSGSEDSN